MKIYFGGRDPKIKSSCDPINGPNACPIDKPCVYIWEDTETGNGGGECSSCCVVATVTPSLSIE